jgi:hypothetical protein
MLPIPFIKYIPKLFQQDQKAITMATKIDTHLAEWKIDVLNLRRFIRPDEAPAAMLDELGYELNAGIKTNDTVATKRKKIYNAVQSHKFKNTWPYDVKLRIEAITGQTATLYYPTDDNNWLLRGVTPIEPSDYQASMGISDGTDTALGIWMLGSMEEVVVPGNIYIDLGAGLTTPILEAVVSILENDAVPAYMYVYLGYTT